MKFFALVIYYQCIGGLMKRSFSLKKFFSLALILCFGLVGGIILTGCSSDFELKVGQDKTDLYSISISADGETLTKADSYTLKKDQDIRVDVVANKAGVDFSNLKAKFNGTEHEVFKYSAYDVFAQEGSDNLKYGYILIPKINQNVEISFSGAKVFEPQITITVPNFSNEEITKKIAMTQIEIDGTYEKLAEKLDQNGKLVFTKQFSQDLVNSLFKLNLKFDGTNPFNLAAADIVKINLPKETVNAQSIAYKVGEYVVDLGNLPQLASYDITFDFGKVTYQDYFLNLPEKCLSYEVYTQTTGARPVYNEDFMLCVKITDDKVDTSELKLLANNKELELVSTEENVYTFKLAQGSTPSGEIVSSTYDIKLQGLTTTVDKREIDHIINSLSGVKDAFATVLFGRVGETGNVEGYTFIDEDGKTYLFDGEKGAIEWEYSFNPIYNTYVSAYDLKNYKVYLNDEVLADMAEILTDKTETFEQQIGDYKFYATADANGIFYKFRIEFAATQDFKFAFGDFVLAKKNFNVSTDIEDSNISLIEFSFKNSDGTWADWQNLTSEALTYSLACGDVIGFRISHSATFDASAVVLESTQFVNYASINTDRSGATAKTTITYNVANLFSATPVDLVLTINAR